jgi:RNA polymerase sigma factor (sigma-70 family)
MSQNIFRQSKKDITEAMLWNDFRKGDLEAFTKLYRKYLRPLYNYGKKICTNNAFVEDCIQDLFVELWKNKAQLNATESPKYYLFKSLRRKIFRELSGNKLLFEVITEEYNFEITLSAETDLIYTQHLSEQQLHLQKALEALTKRQREAIFLRFYENLSYEEVASIMSLELRSTYNLISKAIDALKRSAPYSLLTLFFPFL